jgi:spore germination protein GerM
LYTLATVTVKSELMDTSTENMIKTAILYMTDSPVSIDGFYNILPEGTKVKSIKIDGDSIYIDFSKEILFPKYPSAESESLALCAIAGVPGMYGIQNTYVSVEGKTSGPIDGKYVEDFWGHVGLYDEPLHPCRK